MRAKLVIFSAFAWAAMTMSSHAQFTSMFTDAGVFGSFSEFQSSSAYSSNFVEITSTNQFLSLFGLTPGSLTSTELDLISSVYFGGNGTFYIDPSNYQQVLITPSSPTMSPSPTTPTMSPSPGYGYSSSSPNIIPGFDFETTADFFMLPSVLQNAAISSVTSDVDPDPQGTTQRTTQGLRNSAFGRLVGIHAGVEAPMLVDEGGDSLHFEYNYIDSDLDNPGVGIASESNVFALGYERYLGGGLYLDLTYEYADNQLSAGALGINGDTHTVATSLSADLVNNLYGLLIVGGSWASGSTNIAGAQVVGSNGSTFFINPGLGTSWEFGDIIVDGSISYLYQNGSTTSTVAGVPVTAQAQADQVIVELGATYNFTDTLYTRVGAQYNNIVDDNFGAAVPIDENWVQLTAELGTMIGSSTNAYIGYAYDAGHNIYDIHTYRAGFSIGF